MIPETTLAMNCQGNCHPLFKRKEFQAIVSGQSERLSRARNEKIKKLNQQQSGVIDGCLERGDWSSYFSLGDAIAGTKKQINDTLLFEMSLLNAHSLFHRNGFPV